MMLMIWLVDGIVKLASAALVVWKLMGSQNWLA
jgi:hypothetical protein